MGLVFGRDDLERFLERVLVTGGDPLEDPGPGSLKMVGSILSSMARFPSVKSVRTMSCSVCLG